MWSRIEAIPDEESEDGCRNVIVKDDDEEFITSGSLLCFCLFGNRLLIRS